MAEQDNINIVRKSFDFLNNHDLDSWEQFVAKDFRVEATGAPAAMDRTQNKAYIQGFISAFPDLHFKVKDIIAQGNKVAATWVVNGTHNNPLRTPTGDTIPATGRKTNIPGCTVYEFNQNNQVARQEIYWDQGLLMSQLGLMQAQGNRSASSMK